MKINTILTFGLAGTMAIGAAVSITAAAIGTYWGFLAYIPSATFMAYFGARTVAIRRAKTWSLWTGPGYPWGELYGCYGFRWELEFDQKRLERSSPDTPVYARYD